MIFRGSDEPHRLFIQALEVLGARKGGARLKAQAREWLASCLPVAGEGYIAQNENTKLVDHEDRVDLVLRQVLATKWLLRASHTRSLTGQLRDAARAYRVVLDEYPEVCSANNLALILLDDDIGMPGDEDRNISLCLINRTIEGLDVLETMKSYKGFLLI